MKHSAVILRGNLVYAPSRDRIEVRKRSWLAAEDGIITGIFDTLPPDYAGLPCTDYGDRLIIPGMTDLHIHAPQYTFRGLGMDLELLDWLNAHTFPAEARYKDLTYAERAYRVFVRNLRQSTTTRACIFATIHRQSTLLLMDLLEKSGLYTMVGKVNMDRNSPEYLCEASAQASAEDTRAWLREITARQYRQTFPILTPRFIPSCSDALMEQLHLIQQEQHLPVQSHLSENQSEADWVKELCPWSRSYGDAYDHFGLFGSGGRTIMAHCVLSGEEEVRLMKERGVFVAHCPESNMNLSSGVAPIKRYLEQGLRVGLGSDVAAGSTENLFTAMSCAIRASKLRWRLLDQDCRPLTVSEVFYLATKGGGAFFGKVGSFEPGYELDAVVLDDSRIRYPQDTDCALRLERMVYLADEREVFAKYVQGHKLF